MRKRYLLAFLLWTSLNLGAQSTLVIDQGLFTIAAGSYVVLQNTSLENNDGAGFSATGDGVVVFSGTAVGITLSGTAATTAIKNVILDNPGGLGLDAQNLTVNGSFDFQQGILDVQDSEFALFGTVLNAGPTQYVRTSGIGVLARSIDGTQFFPVGNSTYNPLTFEALPTEPGNLTVRVIDGVLDEGGTGLPLAADAVDRTWEVGGSPTVYGASAIRLSWNGAEELPGFDRNNAYVAQGLGTICDLLPPAAATGSDPYELERTGFQAAYFAVLNADISPPLAACQDITVALGPNGDVSVPDQDVDAGSTDDNGLIFFSLDDNYFTCADVGPNMVTLTVTDQVGNLATCMATITVEDNTGPDMLCLNPTLSIDTNGELTISPQDLDGGSTDNCTATNLSVNFPTLGCNAVGNSTLVTLTGTDAYGNQSTCVSTVTIVDAIAPTAKCRNTTRALSKAGRYKPKVNHVDLNSFDNCGISSYSVSPAIFFCSDIGEVEVTLTVTDDSGNQSSCIGIITLIDDFTPKIRCPLPITVDGDPVTCDAVVDYTVLYADNCSGAVLSQLQGLPSGSAFPVGTTGNIFEVVDGVGLSKQCAFNVTVTDPGGCVPQAPESGQQALFSPAGSVPNLTAFPNPFTGKTQISFQLETEGEVRLGIYDVNGRLVQLLDEAWYDAGVHSLPWNALESKAGPGIYFVQLQFGSTTQTHRLVLLQ
ncbi:MAG: HYR domain-containing protein [Phaeodactylibacter sp.]|nr:HYR domain-containing protein [Phaeodactylibacter sp.]